LFPFIRLNTYHPSYIVLTLMKLLYKISIVWILLSRISKINLVLDG
jgi:hypothetical protein